MNGMEATSAIREMEDIQQPRIVALSADAMSESIDACLESGMGGFVTKPFKFEEITPAYCGRPEETDGSKAPVTAHSQLSVPARLEYDP